MQQHNSAEATPAGPKYTVSIDQRTNECLDFDVILQALREETATILGKEICKERYYQDASVIQLHYSMVDQLSSNLAFFPLRTSINIWPVLRSIELNMSPPEKEDLAEFSQHIEQVMDVQKFLVEYEKELPLFTNMAIEMDLPDDFKELMVDSFDEDGNLNADKYPIIKELRSAAATQRGRILQTIQGLLRSTEMKDKLSDTGYIEVDGRFCLMLKNTYKKGVGIVHGSSNTGRSLYIEPMQIVEPTNEMKSLLAKLREEENAILSAMCKAISLHRESIKTAVRAVAEVDVYRAKAKLGIRLGGIVPEVKDEGVLRCTTAKHPVLMLRGVDPVGNDFSLSTDSAALVISGPNAGGKTIVLKTAGLYGLMVRHAIPIPTRPGARVDLMHVMADIGDMQTVSGDLSTFSGHLVVCREMLAEARRVREEASGAAIADPMDSDSSARVDISIETPLFSGERADDDAEHDENVDDDEDEAKPRSSIDPLDRGISLRKKSQPAADTLEAYRRSVLQDDPNRASISAGRSNGYSLVLLDEIGTGTDPAQGAALAQAILEELVEMGSRVIVTTHYQRIKELAASDERFRIAAMEFVDNRPTYRLRMGSVGESFALEAARRMELPETLLTRANALLDDETRRIVALQQRLEEETELARQEQQKWVDMKDALKSREEELENDKENLQAEIKKLQDGRTDEFLVGIKTKEAELERLLRQASEAALSTNSSLSRMDRSKTIEEVKLAVKAVKTEMETKQVEQIAENIATPLVPGEPLDVGTPLVVLEKGTLFGSRGLVSHRNKGRGKVFINIAGAEVKIDRHLLGVPLKQGPLGLKTMKDNLLQREPTAMSAKDRRMLEMLEKELVDPDKMVTKAGYKGKKNKIVGLRSAKNTVDVRNKGLEEAQKMTGRYIENYIDTADYFGSTAVIYINHGAKITKEFKEKYRSWLAKFPLVSRVQQAEMSDGGEAFTIIELELCD
jgi:dsDNA-specific endonuclease/ATPase MutS2